MPEYYSLSLLEFFQKNEKIYSERLGLFDFARQGEEIHASGLGPNFSNTWPLINRTSCPINNFTLGNPVVYLWTGTGFTPYAGTVTGSYSTFSLAPNGGIGTVTANFTFTLPPDGIYRIYFDIITDDGEILKHVSNSPPGYGRLWADVGASIAACYAPQPSINSVDHVNLGYGNVAVNAEVQNAAKDPTLKVDDNESTMKSGSNDDYNSSDVTDHGDSTQGKSTNKVKVVGKCDTEAFLKYNYYTNYSAYLGAVHKLQCNKGCQTYIGDPVNTAIGNFIQQETDAKVAGPGDSTINLTRTYNSQALLWTPASLKRYYPDGSDEVIAEPPQYFGKGWTSEFGQYLLEIDMAPTFEGVQLLYADGHTANFKKSGNKYISASPGTHDVISKEGNEYVLKNADTLYPLEEKRFNKAGYLTALVDRNGNRISLIYEGDKLTALKNAAGRQIDFELNNDGRITKIHLPENITLTYEYTDDLLTAFIDGRGGRTEYHYDDFGQMTEIISPNGYPSVRNTYDDDYRVSEQTVKENEHYTFTYKKGKTTVTDSYGNATVHHYDDNLKLVQTDYPDGTSEHFTFDDDLNRTAYIDQDKSEWKWTYDDNGNRLTETGPLSWYQKWEYNDRNQVEVHTQQIDKNKTRSTKYSYDSNGNVTDFCLPLGDCGKITYNPQGQPLNMTDLRGYTTVNTYDAEGDLVKVTDPEKADTLFDHDGLGRIISKKKPLGNLYRYTYDNNSNLTDVDGQLGFHLGYTYDANDNLIQKDDPNKGTIRYFYTKSDSIEDIYNQLQFKTSFSYGLMNERRSMTDAENRIWRYDYNNMLRVSDINGPLGWHQGFTYSNLGLITDVKDAEGRVRHVEYDALRHPLSITQNYRPGEQESSDTNVTTSFTYNLVGDRLSVTDPEGYVFKAEYDLQGRLKKKTDAENYEWEYSYDPMGNLLSEVNPREFKTKYTYSPTNRLHTVTDPENHIRKFDYNLNGSLSFVTDPKGTVTKYDYNELDRKVAQIRNYRAGAAADHETNVTTKFDYDLAGNLRFVTNPLNYKAEIRYDKAHRKAELIDYEGGKTFFAYDKVNNLIKVTDAEGNATNYTVNGLDQLVSVTNAEDETTKYTHDLVGNRTQRIEADNTVTLYEFDGVYRLNRVHENYRSGVEPGNDVNVLTQYGYDRRGLLTSLINANNAETIFAYNGVGKLVKETDPLSNVWEFAYDGNRNKVLRKDANGDQTEYAFYPDDQLQSIAYADGTRVSYAYDENNNRIGMNDKLGDSSWEFDPLNRVILQDDPFSRVVRYQYDAASNRIGITYPDTNQVAYEYSPNNWLKTMIDPASQEIKYTRDLVGNLTRITNPNETRTSIDYDKVYRALEKINWQETNQSTINSAFNYTYNDVGHITEAVKKYGWRNPSTITETYNYDGLHRLSFVKMSPLKNNGGAVQSAYQYDPVGNRLSWASNDDLQTNTPFDGFYRHYEYNQANQMLAMEYAADKKSKDYAYKYSYDLNGNRINRQLIDRNGPQYGVDYSYDPENRLVTAQDYQLTGKNGKNRIDRAVTGYEYDGGGRRLVQHYDPKNGGNGVDKRDEYTFDGLDPIAEYDKLNGQRTDYYRGDDNQLAMMHLYKGGTQGQMYWYHLNQKGDVVGLTKQNGNSHHNYRYDPYGGVIPENGNFTDPHNHYTLTGKEFDENTGLVWFGARFYEPETGVWMNQDSYRGQLNQPMSLHRYGYVNNNPILLYDLYGFTPPVDPDRLPSQFRPDSLYHRNVDMLDFYPGCKEDVRGTMLDNKDYSNYALTREEMTDVVNYNYGYAGAKNGIPLNILLRFGDIFQYASNKQGCYVCVPKDNPKDAAMIAEGFNDYVEEYINRNGLDLTTAVYLQLLGADVMPVYYYQYYN